MVALVSMTSMMNIMNMNLNKHMYMIPPMPNFFMLSMPLCILWDYTVVVLFYSTRCVPLSSIVLRVESRGDRKPKSMKYSYQKLIV